MRVLLIVLTVLMSFQILAQVKVKGYYRKDGTYVKPHYRSNPDGNPYNNWSYPGNVNPYTEKVATGNPDTYLKNYYNNYSNSYSYSSYRYPSSTYSAPSNNSFNNNYYSNYYYVKSNYLNVRSGPSTNYSIIGTLSYFDNVKVIDSYNNGWKKIEYSQFDYDSYSFKNRVGYVSGNYLSSSNPYNLGNNNIYNNYSNRSNFSNNTFYDSYVNSPPYGYDNGILTIWTDCGDDGEIKIYLDDIYIGKLTQYFTNVEPHCGQYGTVSVFKPAGTYRIEAKGTSRAWSGTITIKQNQCSSQKLSKHAR